MAGTTAAAPLAHRASGADLGIVAATEIGGAVLLGVFLLTNSSPLIVALLVLLGAAFSILQIRPSVEERIVAAFRRARGTALGLGVVIVVVYPFTMQGNSYALHLLVISLLYAVLALALNFQLGSANIPNFATGASYGIGAYTSALLAINYGVSFWLTLPVAAVVATIFGFLLGFPSMRTRETYLALVTIAFGIVVHQLLNNFDWTGGPNGLVGIPAPSIAGHSFAEPLELFGRRLPSQANFYYLAAVLVALAIVSARRLHDSRIGLAWNALRGDELAARCQGINVVWYKMLAFAVDAFLAAFAGSVYAAFKDPVHMYRGTTMAGIVRDESGHDTRRGFVGGYEMETLSLGLPFIGAFLNPGGWGADFAWWMERYANLAGMWLVGEDMPRETDRITHNTDVKDQSGNYIPNVHFDDHDNDVAMRNHAFTQAERTYQAAGAIRTFRTPPYPSTHNLGTARMSARAQDGVCNKWGQTHDIPNLFISDGSQFTTGGAENPTLTIVSLAIRQAEYIASQMTQRAL